MSEPVQVAVVVGIMNILGIIVSRLLSRREHRATHGAVERIEKRLNGTSETH